MKVGDLVIMPREHVPEGYIPSVGIVVADDYRGRSGNLAAGKKRSRIGVMWTDSSCVDYEPRDWLEVISENR